MGGGDQVMHFVLRVDAVHPVRIHHVVDAQRGLRCVGALQRAVRLGHVQPHREEDIDLVDVILQRGVAAGVIIHVVGGAQAFAGIEGDLRRLAAGLAPRRLQVFGLDRSGLFLDGPVVPLGRGQQKLRQVLILHHVEKKQHQNHGGHHRHRVQNAPEAFPAFPLRIEENLAIHAC